MINKSIIKLIKSLSIKKHRINENLFLVEGDKNVREVLNSNYSVSILIATESFVSNNKIIVTYADKVILAQSQEIKKVSLLKNPQSCIALCKLPSEKRLPVELNDISIYLDDIQDPGNLGTIIRTCDWFGINDIFCSLNTVDLYNPKVIQATMGSFSRVNVYYSAINKLDHLKNKSKVPFYGTFLDGSNIYTEHLQIPALIVVGNEGNGIGKSTEGFIDKRIRIPGYRSETISAESLNVAVATAIICSEFRRHS